MHSISLKLIFQNWGNEKQKKCNQVLSKTLKIFIHIQVHYTLWICPLDLNTYISVQPEKEGSKLVLESCLSWTTADRVSKSLYHTV